MQQNYTLDELRERNILHYFLDVLDNTSAFISNESAFVVTRYLKKERK